MRAYIAIFLVSVIGSAKTALGNGWCSKYSRESQSTQEDITVQESFHLPDHTNCLWEIHFKHATKLQLEFEITKLPFSVLQVYNGFAGIISKRVNDFVTISLGKYDGGRVLFSAMNQTVQRTSTFINNDALCFQHFAMSKNRYDENRLELRIRVSVKEVKCQDDQRQVPRKDMCKTVCFPNNRTSELCPSSSTATVLSKSTVLLSNTSNKPKASTTPVTKTNILTFPKYNWALKYIINQQGENQGPTQQTPYAKSTTEETIEWHSTRAPRLERTSTTIAEQETRIQPVTEKSEMDREDVMLGLYIASTIAGVFTVTTIVLIICCAYKTREVKKLTKIMFHLSKSKNKNENFKLTRQEISGWSSVSSSLRPSLPPRPSDLPSISDTRSIITRINSKNANELLTRSINNDNDQKVMDEVYDNIGHNNHDDSDNNKSHRTLQNDLSYGSHKDHNQNFKKFNTGPKDMSKIFNQDANHKRFYDSLSLTVSRNNIPCAEYIDTMSTNSHTYRKVNKQVQ